MNTSAVVVIPLITTDLKDFEKKSLEQCFRVLRKWPIVFIAPEGLDPAPVLAMAEADAEVIYFARTDFSSIASYNRLLTSQRFYRKFTAYEYMLLYQLDAYVFEDRLEEWCRKGFDYIGAPAFHAEGYECLQAAESDRYRSALDTNRLVYNGGLSLRKIKAMLRLLNVHNTIYPSWKGNEDMLFSLASTRLIPFKPLIKLPDWSTALDFAFEKSPAASYILNGNRLPFGCHAWQRYDPGFWETFMGQHPYAR